MSEYAARAYLALLDLGLTEARDVSTLSRVPTSKIYHILEQLHEKGLVTILPEFPKKYAPVPFDEYLDKLQEEHEEAAHRIERDRGELAELFSVIGSVEAGDRGGFTVLRGRRNILAKIAECNAGTEREMFVLGSQGFALRIGHSWDDIQRGAKRGVKMRFLVPLTAETLPTYGPLAKIADVRAREFDESTQSGNVAIGIHDNQRAIVIHFVPDDGHLYQGNDTAIFTDHEGMVSVIRALVEPHWARATPFEARETSILTGRAPEFTRFYGTLGEAVSALRGAIARGMKDLRSVSALPAEMPNAVTDELATMLEAAGAQARSIVNVTRREVAEALVARVSERPWSDVRHVEPSTLSRFWIIDDREAFFSLVRPRGATFEESEDLVIHTNNPSTVRSLGARFDELWASGAPLGARLEQLQSSPESGTVSLRPGAPEPTVARGRSGNNPI